MWVPDNFHQQIRLLKLTGFNIFSLLLTFDTSRAGLEHTQKSKPDSVEWGCAVLITITLQHQKCTWTLNVRRTHGSLGDGFNENVPASVLIRTTLTLLQIKPQKITGSTWSRFTRREPGGDKTWLVSKFMTS